jgi:hypothetical protein
MALVRTLLLLGALGASALGVAAPASADGADFIKYLRANGVDVPTPELRKRLRQPRPGNL